VFYQPKDIQKALELKPNCRNAALFLAGAPISWSENHGKAAPENFIDLTHIYELRAIHKHNAPGAGRQRHARANRQATDPLPRTSFAKCWRPEFVNSGTIAGNLATASPAGDGSAALLALDGKWN